MTTKPIRYSTLILVFSLLLHSCASRYSSVSPQELSFVSKSDSDQNVILHYKYQVLKKKYRKKEEKKGIRIVALKITNNSLEDLKFSENLLLNYANGDPINLISKEEAFKELKQTTPTYLLYLLLSPLRIVTTETNSFGFEQETSNIPIGLIVGPGLALGNFLAASSANKKFSDEMATNELIGRTIKPNETVTGLVALRSDSYEALQLTVKE